MKVETWVAEDAIGELAYWDLRLAYGDDKCLALVGHGSPGQLQNDLEEAIEDAVWAEDVDLIEEMLAHVPRVSNRGFSTVYYWPSIQVTEDE